MSELSEALEEELDAAIDPFVAFAENRAEDRDISHDQWRQLRVTQKAVIDHITALEAELAQARAVAKLRGGRQMLKSVACVLWLAALAYFIWVIDPYGSDIDLAHGVKQREAK